MLTKLKNLLILMRFHRPIPLLLLLWPIWWALWIAARGMPSLKLWVIFTLGLVLMRAAGCVINDYADRRFDGHVSRTQHRPLVTGAVSSKEALSLAAVLCLISFSLVCQLNTYTIALSFAVLFLGIIYPFMKRYTHFPQVILGMAWYSGILMAFTATLNHIPLTGWLLYIASICWAVAYDTMYAIVDRVDDKKIGVKSTAIFFEHYEAAFIGTFQSLVLLILLLAGCNEGLAWPYFTGLIAASGFFLYQQYLIRGCIPQRCLAAFNNNHWFGLIVFLGLYITYQTRLI